MKILTFDIGGTGVQAAICDTMSLTLTKKSTFKTPRENISQMLHCMNETIDTVYCDETFEGIALSCAGLVEKEHNIVGKGSFFYEGFGKTIVQDLQNIYKVPVSIENDGNCAALAEYWIGNGKDVHSLTTIVIGTAIGGAILVDGKILRGFNNLAGEYGFILYPQAGGLYNIWSEEGSTQSIVQLFAKAYPNTRDAIDGRKLFELELEGHQGAHQYIEKLINLLAEQCFNLQYIIDPEKILIGGGISSNEELVARVNTKIEQIATSKRQTVVYPIVEACKFGNDANLYGAVYDWLQENNKLG